MSTRIHRRQVLRGLGGAAISLPVLPSLLPARRAEAATRPPLRLVVMHNRDGTFPSQFWPSAEAKVRVDEQVWHTPLADIAGPLSPVLGTEFDSVRAKVNVVRGMDLLCFAFHQAATFLCCSSTNKERFGEEGPPTAGSAVDCVVEHSAGFYGSERPPLGALRISDGSRRASYWRPAGGREGTATLKPFLKGAQAVFDAVVTRARPATEGPTTPDPARAEDRLLTDHLLAEYKQFVGQIRLSAEDRRRVEQHYQLVHELQKQVLAAEARPAASQACGGLLGKRPEGTRAIDRYTSYLDGIAAALACGVTRVAVLVLNHYDDDGQIRADVHHSNSHAEYRNGRTPQENTRIWDGWLARRVAYLVKKLDSIREPDGSTLLDNTVVVWGNEDGYGKSHSSEEIPLVMAGSAGGRLRTGHYLDFRERPITVSGETPAVGWPLAGFWVSVMQALGVPSSEYLKQGDAGGFGQMDSHFARRHKDVAARRSRPLPFLSRAV